MKKVVTLCLLALSLRASEIIPPVLTPIGAVMLTNRSGEELSLADRDVKFTLFFPLGWSNAAASNLTATIHFHTVASSTIPWHVQRGSKNPLLVFALGSGSAAYRAPFEDTNRFTRVLALVEGEMKRRGVSSRLTNVEISSFSAGYGAVRELVKSPADLPFLRRIVLLDSIYGGLVMKDGKRTVDPEHIDVWVPFAESAMRGERTFVITLSQIEPANFASTVECASALLDRVGLKFTPVASDKSATPYPLLARADDSNLHVWSYAGTNAPAHMAHVRHMADVWRAIDSH